MADTLTHCQHCSGSGLVWHCEICERHHITPRLKCLVYGGTGRIKRVLDNDSTGPNSVAIRESGSAVLEG